MAIAGAVVRPSKLIHHERRQRPALRLDVFDEGGPVGLGGTTEGTSWDGYTDTPCEAIYQDT